MTNQTPTNEEESEGRMEFVEILNGIFVYLPSVHDSEGSVQMTARGLVRSELEVKGE